MRIKRLLVGALGAALLGATPVALAAAPAEAVTIVQTRIKLVPQAYPVYRYGQTIALRGWVEAYVPSVCETADGWCTVPDTDAGEIYVTLKRAGSTTTGSVGSRENESDFSIGSTARSVATYTIRYDGGVYGDYQFQSSSTTRTIKVSRNTGGKVVKSSGGLYFQGNVDPGWAGRYVTIQKKSCKTCAWRTYKRVLTNRYGGYQARIYAPRTGYWFWRSYVPATSPTFVAAYSSVWRTYQT